MKNVSIRSGFVRKLIDSSGDATGGWKYKDAPDSAVQLTVTGTGTVTATATIQCSNDGINVAVVSTTMTASGTSPASTGTVVSGPWKYMRVVLSGTLGTGAASTVTVSD